MNIKRMNTLADTLANGLPRGVAFNMNVVISSKDGVRGWRNGLRHQIGMDRCDTVCCLAGLACMLWSPSSLVAGPFRIEHAAASALGLNKIVADRLFHPYVIHDYDAITPLRASRCVKDMVITGRADWLSACGWAVEGGEWVNQEGLYAADFSGKRMEMAYGNGGGG